MKRRGRTLLDVPIAPERAGALWAAFCLFLFGLAPVSADEPEFAYFLADGARVPLHWLTDELVIDMEIGASVDAAAASTTRTFGTTRSRLKPATPGRRLFAADLGTSMSGELWRSRAAALTREPGIRGVYPAFVHPPMNHRMLLTDELIVHLKDEDSLEKVRKKASPLRLGLLERDRLNKRIVYLRIENPGPFSALDLCNALYRSGTVRWAEPNFVIELRRAATPSDPLFNMQWQLHNTGQVNGPVDVDLDALEAWDITRGRPGIVIAILDDGMEIDHPDLLANIYINPNEIPNNGVDDDDNGYVDDVNGWDFFRDDNNPGPDGPADVHATPVAGLAGAVGDNGIGVTSVAPGCRILPCRLLGEADPTVQQVTRAIQYAATNADVLSMSWTASPLSTIETNLLHAATSGRMGLGCPLVAATGNGGYSFRIGFPASLDFVMAVGASNYRDVRSSYSNYVNGFGVFVLAPSSDRDSGPEGVYTTKRRIALPYGWFSGTSAATPQVAGAAALVLSVSPDSTRQQVEDAIRNGADKVSPQLAQYDSSGYSSEYGYGRLNVHRALLHILPDLAPVAFDFSPTVVTQGGSLTVSGSVRNLALAPSQPAWLEFWLSRSGTFSTQDHIAVSSVRIPVMQPGAEFVLPSEARELLPGIPDGLYQFGIVIDRLQEVDETSESNNTLYHQAKLLQMGVGSTDVDLKVHAFDFSPTQVDGEDPVALSGTVVNSGSQMSRPVWVEFWVSERAIGGTFEHFLCESARVGPLGPGETFSLSTLDRTINRESDGLPEGRYRVGVVVDPMNEQPDTNVSNNTVFRLDKWLRIGEQTVVRQWRLYR